MKQLKTLLEIGRTIGYYDAQAMNNRHDDPHARAVDMINQAVEDNEDHFELIGDVDSLVQYLKGKYHDFNPQLEQLVRDIIAEETGSEEEQEEIHNSRRERRPKFQKPQHQLYTSGKNNKYQGKLKNAARMSQPKGEY